jgi:error-prone DNA polymerase
MKSGAKWQLTGTGVGWRAERAGQSVGPLFANIPDEHELEDSAPLLPMTTEERLVADFGGTGLTMGPHLMAYHRADMNSAGVIAAADLRTMPDEIYTSIAGVVIARQRPGTASGFVFLSLEDETGISNAITNPHLYERNREAVTRGKSLQVEGTLQNQDGVVSVKASAVRVLELSKVDVRSHDFHRGAAVDDEKRVSGEQSEQSRLTKVLYVCC